MLTESLLLAAAAGSIGVLFARWGVNALLALAPPDLPRLDEVTVDLTTLGFTLLVSVFTGLAFGLAPALQVSRTNLNEVLKEGTRGGATSTRRRASLRQALAVAEIALSLVLLVSAGLLITSIRRLTEVNPGFDTQNLLTVNVSFPRRPARADDGTEAGAQRELQETASFLTGVQGHVSSLPGVESVGAINNLPVAGFGSMNGDFNIDGRPKFKPGEAPVAEFRLVTPTYFRAIGIPLLRGRTFGDGEGPREPVTIMVNETLARRFFPGEDALGKRLLVLDDEPHEIVGIVGDARQWGLDKPADPEVYFSYAQMGFDNSAVLVIRTSVEPSALSDGVRRAVREVNHDAPVYSVKTMAQVVADSTAQRRFNAVLMACFAGVALLMAGIGLYGVISYTVAQRVQEIGIRMALGAQVSQVLGMVLWNGLKLALAGVGLGVLVAFALTRVLAGLLYGVSATDPSIFLAGSAFLVAVALLACYVPARRATKVDPMIALRYE
jgi:putative ABC transport system permease protein